MQASYMHNIKSVPKVAIIIMLSHFSQNLRLHCMHPLQQQQCLKKYIRRYIHEIKGFTQKLKLSHHLLTLKSS